MKIQEPKFLCCNSRAKRIVLLLQYYADNSGDEVVFTQGDVSHKYDILYTGKLTKNRENEFKMYALGCFDTMIIFLIKE